MAPKAPLKPHSGLPGVPPPSSKAPLPSQSQGNKAPMAPTFRDVYKAELAKEEESKSSGPPHPPPLLSDPASLKLIAKRAVQCTLSALRSQKCFVF